MPGVTQSTRFAPVRRSGYMVSRLSSRPGRSTIWKHGPFRSTGAVPGNPAIGTPGIRRNPGFAVSERMTQLPPARLYLVIKTLRDAVTGDLVGKQEDHIPGVAGSCPGA